MKSLVQKITNIQAHLDHIEENHIQILHRLDLVEGKLETQAYPAKHIGIYGKIMVDQFAGPHGKSEVVSPQMQLEATT